MKPVILSGIQPSGKLNIGHYLGALKSWVNLQKSYDCLFMVVDLHAITVRQNPALLKELCLSFAAQYIALGIDPEESTIFIQSAVPEHAQLGWILTCNSGLGELQRMTQFKDKASKQEHLMAGLLCYPALMAADILLYNTSLVPVGEDQKQHLELTRDLAQRMNQNYGDLFTVPEPFIPPVGARIMSLQNPLAKMSKSDPDPKSSLNLLDGAKDIDKKCKSAVTDSLGKIQFDPQNQPGIANLLTILSGISGKPVSSLLEEFNNQQYGHLKVATANACNTFLEPIRARTSELMQKPEVLEEILHEGARKARARARKTLEKVHALLGLSTISI